MPVVTCTGGGETACGDEPGSPCIRCRPGSGTRSLVIVIAGGEPLVRQEEILTLAKAHPRVLFPVFTNGLLIDDGTADRIAQCRNIVPVISFEGFREETDQRRGARGL